MKQKCGGRADDLKSKFWFILKVFFSCGRNQDDAFLAKTEQKTVVLKTYLAEQQELNRNYL